MKIIFFGTSEFAVPSLKKLSESKHEILLVVTQPDRKKGRHLHLASPPVKVEAGRLNIPVHQTDDLMRPDSVKALKEAGAELFVVVSFGQILKKEILNIPKLISINLHASVLPKYRGAAPMNWAIVKGEEASGVSVIRMNSKMDEGDIILSEEARILPDDTALTLNEKFSAIGSTLLLRAVDLIESRKAKFTKQNNTQVSYAPKLKKENGLIDWKKPAFEIRNLVRGMIPWPGAFTHLAGRTLKIWKTEIDTRELSFKAGQVADLEEGLVVKTGKDNLVIKELQMEGAKVMDSGAFLRGHKVKLGDKLG